MGTPSNRFFKIEAQGGYPIGPIFQNRSRALLYLGKIDVSCRIPSFTEVKTAFWDILGTVSIRKPHRTRNRFF